MTVKVNILFQSATPVSGWSEVYYHSGSDITGVQTDVTALITARLSFLPTDTLIVGYRAYVIGQKRFGITVQFAPPMPGTWTTGDKSTEPWTALLVQLYSGFQVKVAKYLHGIPQSQVAEGVFTPSGPWLIAYGTYIGLLESTWKMWAKDPAAGGNKKEWSFTTAVYQRLVTHRIGRPFALQVGRRLART